MPASGARGRSVLRWELSYFGERSQGSSDAVDTRCQAGQQATQEANRFIALIVRTDAKGRK
jgi:hypothetical protein